ncbi:hypothetical protein GPECTOR_50g614 [Gonium pectorale]|uniref:Sister chromatid cohesion protein n=1 Tax=Gonium pectorale TaxID=33097 RepID=A0A150G8Y2_GONPE|nr:hypothetical protein GPECTOR_50g614 [Gonium pectorale]|eukprot:KXZ45820.1 hypothetical protein GPECTOR_50g614 [Gonium pectorale]
MLSRAVDTYLRTVLGVPSVPRWCPHLAGQLEQALSLLAEVASGVRLAAEGLIPLVRMSQQALTVDSLQTLHCRALGLAVAMFKAYPQQRNTVIDEFVQSVLSHLFAGKNVARHYPLRSTDPPTRIQMSTALIMQLVQAAAELPSVDTSMEELQTAINLPSGWSDYFWAEVFKKLPSARGAKAEPGSLKLWVEALVTDLLAALPLPEWPAAAVLLRRLIMAVNGEHGMKSPDSGVKLVCVDLLGLVSRKLCVMAQEVDAPEAVRAVNSLLEAAAVSAGKDAASVADDKAEVVQQLLLEHLAASELCGASGPDGDLGPSPAAAGGHVAATSLTVTARQLVACNMLSARVKALKQEQGLKADESLDEQQLNELAVHYRQIHERQRSCLGTSTSGLPEASREAAVALCRWLIMDSVLGRSRSTLLRWLADAGGGGRARQDAHAAAVRAKAIKLLGAAIEADVRVLSMTNVQEGIKGALADDSVLVREAAVDLIGKHISRNAELAVQYYDILVRASKDAGLTVRRRAIRLLWECCVRCPDFKHRSDALLRIVNRATDTEETMKSLVTKICAEIWFLPNIELEDEVEVAHVVRGPRQRALQLGEVVYASYLQMGSAASLPFHVQHPIVVTVRGIVGEDKPEYEAVRAGAREVGDALLARSLELQGESDPTDELFQCLLSLHVLCLADVKVLYRSEDPQKVVRSLAPYIKELPPSADPATRRKAEQLLVVLSLMGGCMGTLRHLDDDLSDGIAADLRNIILRVSHVQAVNVACQCLCSLAKLKPNHRNTVRQEASRYFNHLEYTRLTKDSAADQQRTLTARFLFTMGSLCRYGADILDEEVQDSKHPNCGAALDQVLHFHRSCADNLRQRETAIQALGLILIARPHLAVEVREVRPALESALDRSAPASIKCRCLSSLTELLRVDEEALLGRQAAARQETAAAQQASTMPEAEARAIARRNGEGDTGSVSSGMIQMLWDRIVALASDTTPAPPAGGAGGQTPPATPSGTSGAHGAVVRRRALELIEVIIRGGIVVPWSAIPALCALATDPERDTAARALDCLASTIAANVQFAAGQVPAGVKEAYDFHSRLWQLEHPGQPLEPGKCRPLIDGLSAVWSRLFQPDRALKTKFLTVLLKPLDDGCCLASGSAAKSDPHLLAFMSYLIAELPYKKMDELLTVLHRMNDILSRRAEAVLLRFKELRGEEPAKDARPSSSANGGLAPSPLPPGRAAPAGLSATLKAALAVSLMLLLKKYLRTSFELTPERVAKYDPSGAQRKAEEKLNAVRNPKLRFNASKLRTDVAAGAPRAGPCRPSASAMSSAGPAASAADGDAAAAMAEGVKEVYAVLKELMKQDEHDYKQAVNGGLADADGAEPHSPGGDADGVVINLESLMAAPDGGADATKPPLASRGRGRRGGRGSQGGGGRTAGGRGRGRGRAAAAADGAGGKGGPGAKKGRKRKRSDSDEESEGDDDSGNDEEVYQPRAAKRRAGKAH